MKALLLIIGIATVIIAVAFCPRPVTTKPFSDFEKSQKVSMQIDSMQHALTMSVLTNNR